jgi:beta-glucanase (GH16 family)
MRFLSFVILVIRMSSCSAPEKIAVKNDWKLYWDDEFNYNGLPDSTKWNYDVGGHGWGNNELQYYTKASPKNVEVSNGTLKLKAIREKMDNRDYTSVRLLTIGKADFTYGKVEVRAKLPPGRGLWPAIWMLGSNIRTVNWPDCGEIDIMEHVGFQKDSIFGTVHTKAYNHGIGTQKTRSIFIGDPYDNFHVYAVEWTPDHMNFYLDNTLYNHFGNERKTTAEWPFDSPFFLILNLAVGGNWGGKEGVDKTVFPAAMEVDYVRVYKSTK